MIVACALLLPCISGWMLAAKGVSARDRLIADLDRAGVSTAVPLKLPGSGRPTLATNDEPGAELSTASHRQS
jgi:hypothetical protein